MTGHAEKQAWRVAVWGGAALMLLAPLVAMQVTDEMNWGLGDFGLFAAMLALACGAYELAVRTGGGLAYRAAAAVALAAAFLLVWINLAVGIVGAEDNPANLMFAAVPAVGIVGALIARFRPAGMARALAATALAQAAVGAAALVGGLGEAASLALLTGGFTTLWLGSAWLFRKAAAR